MAMLIACVIWAISSVWVKRLGQHMAPLRQGTGSLLVATPLFVLSWFWLDGHLPSEVCGKSVAAVVYLTLAGSVVGHTLFFYILRHCSVVTVSLITLLSPVLAMTWGRLLADESFTPQTQLGAAMILASLFIFQGLHTRLLRWGRAKLRAAPL